MQRRFFTHLFSFAVALFLILSGCVGHEKAVTTRSTGAGQKVKIEMKAGNHYFDPEVITAHKGQTLILDVANVSGSTHNITVRDPSGNIVVSQDIPADQSVTVEVALPTAGVYPFNCDKPFHTALGMKGRIEAK